MSATTSQQRFASPTTIDSGATADFTNVRITGEQTTNLGTANFTDCAISGNSTGGNGGGLDNSGTAYLYYCTISDNKAAGFGGGVYSSAGKITLMYCTISGNSAGYGGGLLIDKGTAALYYCTIDDNNVTSNGGALDNYGGTATLTDCTITGNSASLGGGVFAGLNSALAPKTTIIGTTIVNNSATSGVGGLYNQGTVSLVDTIVAGNSTVPSGGSSTPSDIAGSAAKSVTGSNNLIGDGGSGGISGGTPANNIVLTTATEDTLGVGPLGDYGGPTETMPLLPGSLAIGAGVMTDYPGKTNPIATDERGLIRGNTVDIGAFQSSLVVESQAESVNITATGLNLPGAVALADQFAGTAISFDPNVFGTAQTIPLGGSELELTNTTLTTSITGTALGLTISGGGASRVFQIDSSVTATITGLSITGGSTAGFGGGILNYGALTVTDSTLTANKAAYGGAILTSGGSLSLANCTIAGNTASISGGGIDARNNITVISCTFTDNLASSGGGGAIDNTDLGEYTITIGDSILSGDSCSYGPEVANAVHSLGHNLVSETDNSSGWGSTDLTGTSSQPLAALLGTLGDDGGPTETISLFPGSPAIGAGAPMSGITTDERGLIRGNTVDIGAFQTSLVVESQAGSVNTTAAGLTLPGAVSLADLFAGTAISFDPAAFSTTQAIALGGSQLELSNTALPMSITGTAPALTISGGGASRVFQIDSGVTATITRLTITGGSTSGFGGGILNYGALTLTDSTLTANKAAFGGAILTSGGSLSVANCTIAGNSAGISGGGIEARNDITVISSTFTDNTASSGGGGAIDNPNGGEYTIAIGDSILSGDSCGYGPEVANAVNSLGYNLVSEMDNSSGWGSTDLTGTSSQPLAALLGSLGNYGGPTPTIPLMSGSPAIGAGDFARYPGTISLITTDQRGLLLDTRGPDIGAFQTNPLIVSTTSDGTGSAFGDMNLRRPSTWRTSRTRSNSRSRSARPCSIPPRRSP